MESKPLFGEESKQTKLLVWLVGLGTLGWVLFGVILSVIKGFTFYQYFFLAVLLLMLCIPMFFLFRWYRNDDLEEKFKYLLLFVILTVWVAGLAVIVYAFNPPVPIEKNPCLWGRDAQKRCLPACYTQKLCSWADTAINGSFICVNCTCLNKNCTKRNEDPFHNNPDLTPVKAILNTSSITPLELQENARKVQDNTKQEKEFSDREQQQQKPPQNI